MPVSVPVPVPVPRNIYVFRVQGDSLGSETAASFPDGFIIVVEPDPQPQLGNCIAASNDKNAATFTKLIKGDGTLQEAAESALKQC